MATGFKGIASLAGDGDELPDFPLPDNSDINDSSSTNTKQLTKKNDQILNSEKNSQYSKLQKTSSLSNNSNQLSNTPVKVFNQSNSINQNNINSNSNSKYSCSSILGMFFVLPLIIICMLNSTNGSHNTNKKSNNISNKNTNYFSTSNVRQSYTNSQKNNTETINQKQNLNTNQGNNTSFKNKYKNPRDYFTTNKSRYYSKDCIKFVQNMLLNFKFKIGKADGKLGPKTNSAIKEFKRLLKLPQNSEIDRDLIIVLVGFYLIDNYGSLEKVPEKEIIKFKKKFKELGLIEE